MDNTTQQQPTQAQPVYTAYNTPPAGMLADRWVRLGAHILHGLIPLVAIFIAVIPAIFYSDEVWAAGYALFVTAVLSIAFIIIDFTLIARRSQSLGKYLLNITVVDDRSFERVNFVEFMLLRAIVGKNLAIIGAMIFGSFWGLIDSLFIFSQDNRTLHDRMASTLVLQLPERHKRNGLLDLNPLDKQLYGNNTEQHNQTV